MTTSQLPVAAEKAALEVRRLEPQITACVRIHVAPDQLAAAFPEHLPRIAQRVHGLGGSIASAPYARYFRFEPGDVDLEIGAPISGIIPSLPEVLLAERGEVSQSLLPGGRAAVLVHVGSYATLGRAWHRMEQLMSEQHLVPVAPGWELYLDDPDATPESELRTELIHPIA
jgi:effector-binding domain-containing protein